MAAVKEYRVEGFKGLDQSRSENLLPSAYSPEAWNMDAENGDLAVAKGYVKHISVPVPDTGKIRRMYIWRTPSENRVLVIAGSTIYHYTTSGWETIYTYNITITSVRWDFEEIRIGTTDYLIIANGETQLVKWSGSGVATAFGSGSYVYEGTISAVSYNMTKALTAAYAEASAVGTYTLTMPAGWAYAANSEIAFAVPSPVISATSIKVKIGTSEYLADYVPNWESNDNAVVKLTSTTSCTISQTVYGVQTVTLGTAISTDWKQRALDIGIQLNEITYALSSIDTGRTLLTLENPTKDALTVGNTAKVRGGVSDAKVGFIEIHFSRLFSAGDAEHPSRLYWSQPPGDTRTIEDWSMDDASDVVSGGFVDVGNTGSDPIVGLKSLSTQLIIFKETSIYRLLGDRPSNYRINHINLDVEKMANTGCVLYGDIPYWLTRSGMYFHNGQTAVLSSAARQIRTLLASASIDSCKACECRDRLYFTLKTGSGEYDDAIVVYDMTERAYMLRKGFHVIDICSRDGSMYLINENRYVYRWGEGTTYDGALIDAFWRTPVTDLSSKRISKAFTAMYLRGTGGVVNIAFFVGKAKQELPKQLPDSETEIVRLPLKNKDKTFYMTIQNEAGGYFKLSGGIEIVYEITED